MAAKMILEFFPDSYIALNQELTNHPVLTDILQNQPANEFELRLAEICTYCDVVLDGHYARADLEKLADILVNKLREKRGSIILASTMPH